MKTLILYICLLPCLLVACMEDKGNYNYSQINELTIDTLKNQVVEIYDTLKLEAKVSCSQNSGDLHYCWYRYIGKTLDMDTLSLEKDLAYKMTLAVGEYDIYLRVTDINSGISTKNSCKVSVVGKFNTGLMVLGEVDGVPNFVFLNDAGKLTELYGPENGNTLGSKPICIANAITDITYLKDILILCNDNRGGVTLNAADLSVSAEYSSLFFIAPDIIKPQAYYKGGTPFGYGILADFIISNGKIHTRQLGAAEELGEKTAFSPIITGSYELSPWAIVNGKNYLFYDNNKGSFLSIQGNMMSTNKTFTALTSKTTDFNPSATGFELVYMAEGAPQGTTKRGFGLFRDKQNQLQRLEFTLGNYSDSWNAKPMELLSKVPVTSSAVEIDRATGYAMSLAKPYLYYSKGSKIYQYELEGNLCFPIYDTDTIPGLANSTIDKIYMEYTPNYDGYGSTSEKVNTTLYVSSSQNTTGHNGTLHILSLDNNGTVKSRTALYKNVCGKTVSMCKK